MIKTNTAYRQYWLSLLLCLLSGAATPLSFAPYDLWGVGLLSVAIFAAIICRPSVNTSHHPAYFFYCSLAFALGLYGTGASWVYVSIYYFGSTSFFLAIVLTALFISAVALLFAVPFYTMKWIKPHLRLLIGFPLLFVFSEWLHTWFLTGFPWLFIGYSHLTTPLAGWAPIGGVLLISLFSVISSATLASISRRNSKSQTLIAACVITVIWLSGAALKTIDWTQTLDKKITVGIVQPNIPQELKWAPEFREPTKERLRSLSKDLWHNDWIVWPEAALPHTYHRSLDFINEIQQHAISHDSVVITGVLFDELESRQYFNSIMGLGDAEGIYHKQRLVPFGEYVPLESLLRGLIDFFDLPFSSISAGQHTQDNLLIQQQYSLASSICYEIVYPALVAQQARGAHVLLTISNDAWFGNSIGPLQHFQMVRMRALETGRYVIRGTNNGVSAIINPDGSIQQSSEQFISATTEGYVVPVTGSTLYMRWTNYLVLLLLMIMAIIGADRNRITKRSSST